MAQSASLYELLIGPAEPLIAAGDRVLISPDAPLTLLPFAALTRAADADGSPAQFFVEWRPLHFVVSATVYAQLKQKTPARRKDQPVLVAFGDPDYGSADGNDRENHLRAFAGRASELRPLPHTREEVEAIAKLFAEESSIYLGSQATEERAKSLDRKADYIHFASHGFLDERFPHASALALSIPAEDTESSENGFLQAWEIIEQMRLDADLVTLSACDTALGKDMGGEGLVGLVRAFQYAGARTVLASLWSVSDRSTAELMKRFYGYLKQGKPKDEALRAAQIEMIRTAARKGQAESGSRGVKRLTKAGEPASFASPFHWAGFQLNGDWQ